MHQKQPPAKVAVAAPSGADAGGLESSAALEAAPQPAARISRPRTVRIVGIRAVIVVAPLDTGQNSSNRPYYSRSSVGNDEPNILGIIQLD